MEATLTSAGGLSLSFLPPENVMIQPGGRGTAPSSPSARSDTGPDIFLSPSRNIGCRLSAMRVRCDTRARDFQPPPKPPDCETDWGHALVVNSQGKGVFSCAGDTVAGDQRAPVLAYGSVARRGPFECRSSEAGMECVNLDTGHGFFVSRGEYRLF